MGGKKAQRTKGNARPSSSGRTALLLSENITNSPFVGFSAFKEANCENSTEGKNDEFDLSNDADICLVFKKLQKKDNVTKTKALLEFADLCDNKDEDLIKALLPFWPKFYNKLALDLDWKVREAVHKAMHRLVNRLKREIAPILKNIMPVWLISFFDPYAPAASAAIISFNESFTNEKQKDVFFFCKSEILAFCRENILKNEMNVISPESEAEKKEFILLNSSMKALSLLLVKLDKEFCSEFIESLLESEKFWTFCSHKNAEIRFSWFKMKTTVCEVYPDLIKKYSAKVCQTSLNYVTDNDPNACSAVWENCCVILPIIDECWKHVNFQNSFRKKLFSAMRKKSYTFVFDKLPSLLDYFPNEAFDEKQKFVQEFFSVFDIAVRNSEKLTHEFREIVVSYFRCLRYFVTTSKIVSAEERHGILENVVNTQVKPMLQRCILDSGSRKRNSLYYKEFTMFTESLDGSDEHSFILSCIEDICLATTESSFNRSELLSGLMHFIHELTSSTRCIEKSLPRRVKFASSSEPEPKSVSILNKKSESKLPQSYEKIIVSLLDQVIKTFECGTFDSRWLLFLKELSTVGEFFSRLHRDKLKSIESFIIKYVTTSENVETGEYSQIADSSISLLFKIFEVTKAEQLFLKMVEFSNAVVMEKVVNNILLLTEDPVVKKWTKNDSASYVMMVAKELVKLIHVNDRKKAEWNPLWNSLTSLCSMKEIRDTCLSDVISLFEETVNENNLNPSDDVVNFICAVSENILFLYTHCDTLTSFHNLLLTFLKLSCEQSNKREKLSSVWTKGITLICENCENQTKKACLRLFADEFHKQLNGSISTREKASILSDNIITFLQIIKKFSKSDDNVVEMLFNSIFLTFEEWSILSSQLSKKSLYSLYFSDALIPQQINFMNEEQLIPPIIYTSFVIMNVFNAFRADIDVTKNKPYLFNQLFSCVSFCYCKELSRLLVYNPSDKIHEVSNAMEESFSNIISNYSNYIENEVIPQLYQLSISKNSIFGVTMKYILKQLSIPKLPECCPLVTQNYTWESLVTMQLVTSQLEKSVVRDFFNNALYQLLSSNSLLSVDDGLSCLALINSITSLDVNLTFEEHINPFLEYMLGYKETKSELYSYKKDNAYLQFAATVIGIYENILRLWKNDITNEQKDLIFCSVTSWIINVSEDKGNLQNSTPFIVFAYRALNLVKKISKIIEEQPDYSAEWTGFHANKIYGTLIPYLCTFDKDLSTPQIYHFLCALSDAVLATSSSQNMSFSNVLEEKICPQYLWGNLKTVPFSFSEEDSILLSNLCPLMNIHRRPLYFTAHHLIMKVLLNIASNIKIETLEDDECYLTPPTHILTILRETDEVVETMLNEFRVGDCCCIVDTSTDSYHCTMCYLLSWMQVLRYSTLLNPENRSLLSGFLTESGLFFKLMNNLFRLMPVSDGTDEIVRTMFLESLKLDVHSPPSACEVQHVACQLFITSLKTMPASVRLWVGSQDKRIVDVVNNFTTMNVSQYMSSEEFMAIQNRDLPSFKNMTIKTRPAAREIFAVYSVEDMSIELTITFASNHPISPVAIDGGKRVGVSSSQWRTWLLQLTTFLTHQNGSIVDGLLLWKKNIDKRFEGVEECMICFYILHGSTCQLPKLTCKHCKKKYHSACLFKWFKTSNNATCPLCRNLFDTKI